MATYFDFISQAIENMDEWRKAGYSHLSLDNSTPQHDASKGGRILPKADRIKELQELASNKDRLYAIKWPPIVNRVAAKLYERARA